MCLQNLIYDMLLHNLFGKFSEMLINRLETFFRKKISVKEKKLNLQRAIHNCR